MNSSCQDTAMHICGQARRIPKAAAALPSDIDNTASRRDKIQLPLLATVLDAAKA